VLVKQGFLLLPRRQKAGYSDRGENQTDDIKVKNFLGGKLKDILIAL